MHLIGTNRVELYYSLLFIYLIIDILHTALVRRILGTSKKLRNNIFFIPIFSLFILFHLKKHSVRKTFLIYVSK